MATPTIAEVVQDASELVTQFKAAVAHSSGLEKALKQRDAEIAKQAAQIAQLEQKLKTPVTLQKVAACSDAAVEHALDVLERRDFMDKNDRIKFASKLKADPNYALELIEKLATLHEFPVADSGIGIPKTAGATAPENSKGFRSSGSWLQ